MNGVMFDDMRNPIIPTELKKHYNDVISKSGLRSYYHLNEESSTLTRYVRLGSGDYRKDRVRTLTLCELDKMQLAYEASTGFDLNNCRTRVPTFFEDNF